MKITTRIGENAHRRWCKCKTVCVSGAAFTESESLLRDLDLFQRLQRLQSIESIMGLLSSINGFFAVVAQQQGKLLAAVDRIRSIPLYYALHASEFYLSDDAEWVRKQVGIEDVDSIAQQEFSLTGYVTGADTLFRKVKQLQAGEWLEVHEDNGVPNIRAQRYYLFNHIEPCGKSDEARLRSELHEVAKAAVLRLMTYANGRLIVLPLSGGNDSRLIALMLKRCGYNNILCFSYGVPGNLEARVSQQVARELGFRWSFIEYSREMWRSWWQSPSRLEYYRMASGWASLPHIQDWPAVLELKRSRKIDSDAIFVPGHSGDFVAGSHIPEEADMKGRVSLALLCDAIFRKHYALARWPVAMIQDIELWRQRCKERAEIEVLRTRTEMANAFERWDWQERQAKYVVNSVRVYESCGYDWWLPFWDVAFMVFWQRIPLRLRIRAEFYGKYIDWICGVSGLAVSNANPRQHRSTRILKRTLKAVLPSRMVNNASHFLATLNQRGKFNQHFLAWYCQYEEGIIRDLTRAGYSHEGISAYQFLEEAGISLAPIRPRLTYRDT